jgi:hypothetical protein
MALLDTFRSQRRQALLHQLTADAQPTIVIVDGQVMKVAATAVVPAQNNPHNGQSVKGDKAHTRIASQVGGDLVVLVRAAQADAGAATPERIDFVVAVDVEGFNIHALTHFRRLDCESDYDSDSEFIAIAIAFAFILRV